MKFIIVVFSLSIQFLVEKLFGNLIKRLNLQLQRGLWTKKYSIKAF